MNKQYSVLNLWLRKEMSCIFNCTATGKSAEIYGKIPVFENFQAHTDIYARSSQTLHSTWHIQE